MTVGEMVRKHRERARLSQEDLAKALKIPVPVLILIEDPARQDGEAIDLFAAALKLPVDVFTGERAPEPTEEEKHAAAEAEAARAKAEMAVMAAKGRYPHVREFLLDPSRCKNPDAAGDLFSEQKFSLAERNVVLYLSTTALYHFCDTNTSSFSFDEYLFKLHNPLLERFEKELDRVGVTGQSREERVDGARSNIFLCDTVENIAIMVLDSFAAELEAKLAAGRQDFAEDLDLPLCWEVDQTLMKIVFRSPEGDVKDEVKLLDVKERK